MYAYVMRPDALPSSYYKFIQRYLLSVQHSLLTFLRTGPIAEPVLDAVRKNNRGKQPIDVRRDHCCVILIPLDDITRCICEVCESSCCPFHYSYPGHHSMLRYSCPAQFLVIDSFSVLHPHNASCTRNFFQVTYDVARKIFPLYSSLTFVPLVALQYKGACCSSISFFSLFSPLEEPCHHLRTVCF